MPYQYFKSKIRQCRLGLIILLLLFAKQVHVLQIVQMTVVVRGNARRGNVFAIKDLQVLTAVSVQKMSSALKVRIHLLCFQSLFYSTSN